VPHDLTVTILPFPLIFETLSVAILMADGGTILLNGPCRVWQFFGQLIQMRLEEFED